MAETRDNGYVYDRLLNKKKKAYRLIHTLISLKNNVIK